MIETSIEFASATQRSGTFELSVLHHALEDLDVVIAFPRIILIRLTASKEVLDDFFDGMLRLVSEQRFRPLDRHLIIPEVLNLFDVDGDLLAGEFFEPTF